MNFATRSIGEKGKENSSCPYTSTQWRGALETRLDLAAQMIAEVAEVIEMDS